MSDTKLVTVEVTEKDISNGKRSDAARCPVARATRRALKGAIEVNGYNMVLRRKNEDRFETSLPARVKTFVTRFDDGDRKKLKPFKFSVRVPRTFAR